MVERREITGTILRFAGPRRTELGLLGGLIADRIATREQQKAAGVRFYADLIVIQADFPARWQGERPVRTSTGAEADLPHQYRWKTRRYPEAIRAARTGQRVTMRATLEPWHNGLGHYLTRCTSIRLEPVPDPEP